MIKRILKSVVALILLTSVSTPLYSFDMTLGVKAGAGHFFFYGPDYEEYKDRLGLRYAATTFKFGFSAGIFATFGLLDELAFEPEVFFTLTGDAHATNTVIRSADLYFLEIPLLIKGRIKAAPGTWNIFGGPDFLFKLGNGVLTLNMHQIGSRIETEFSTTDIAGFQFGMVFGAGYDLPLGPGILTFELREQLCITNIHSPSYFTPNNIKNSGIVLIIGYGFILTQ